MECCYSAPKARRTEMFIPLMPLSSRPREFSFRALHYPLSFPKANPAWPTTRSGELRKSYNGSQKCGMRFEVDCTSHLSSFSVRPMAKLCFPLSLSLWEERESGLLISGIWPFYATSSRKSAKCVDPLKSTKTEKY